VTKNLNPLITFDLKKWGYLTMKRFILCFGTVVLLVVGQLNAQSILFNTFGPGDSYNINVGLTVGWHPFPELGGDAVTGNQFSFGGTEIYYFELIELVMGHTLGVNELDVWLTSDVAGQPGSIMETFHFSGAMGPLGQYNPLIVASSVSNPILYPATNYWFVASVPLGSSAGWNLSSPGVSGTFAQKYGTGPWNVNNSTMSALRVSGSVVPEPSTVILLSVGLLGLFGYGWRRKRKS